MAIHWNNPAATAAPPRLGNGSVPTTAPATTLSPGPAAADRHPALERFGAICGRLLLAQIFVLSGLTKILSWPETNAYMAGAFERLSNYYVTLAGFVDLCKNAVPFLVAAAIPVEVLGGLALALGWKGRATALLLFLFLVPTTLIFHSFWTFPAEARQEQLLNFMKNLAIMGGLCMIITLGSGLGSVDAAQARKV